MTATPRHVIFGTGAIGLAALDALRRRGETVRLIKPVRLRPRPAPPLIASCLFSAIGGSLRCGDSVDRSDTARAGERDRRETRSRPGNGNEGCRPQAVSELFAAQVPPDERFFPGRLAAVLTPA